MVETKAQLFGGCYHGRRVLITGHTGFKGSWLAVWLSMMGAHVTCLALEPERDMNHWTFISTENNNNVSDIKSHIVDITDLEHLQSTISQANPEIIFHLAAQSLVRRSYAHTLETWSVNVMGTAHLLQVCRNLPDLKAVVMVTTDKCYENTNQISPYKESDPLGGHDPYSASKASMEILVSSYRRSFFEENKKVLISSARAGNVIGGGDWSEDRLIPGVVCAVQDKMPLQIRSPKSIRPWQHVLDCLSGYLMLGEKLLKGEEIFADAWNFGPSPDEARSVEDVLFSLQKLWPDIKWETDGKDHVHESSYLTLDSTKAHNILNWYPVWDVEQAIKKTASWYKSFYEDNQLSTEDQIMVYVDSARRAEASWV